MQHSKIVGGSTAKRVINCPGSVALVAKMPPQVESKYAAEGTLLHGCMEHILADSTLEAVAKRFDLTDEQVAKLDFAAKALDEIDPAQEMTFAQEVEVGFGDLLPGVFGNADLVGKLGNRTVVLDWKFGDGVMVEAEESDQGLFYAAAARRTLPWAVEGTTEVEIIIVQPPRVSRWVTTWERVERFERDLVNAVKIASKTDAPLAIGDWCRWCTAKPVCPLMTGEIDRVTRTALASISSDDLGRALALADRLEQFLDEARTLAQARLEKGLPVPGYKLVAKRATRRWADEAKAAQALAPLGEAAYKRELLSPAQAEKVAKGQGVAFPADQVVSVSSGNTIAAESDPRPAVMVMGEQLRAALAKVR